MKNGIALRDIFINSLELFREWSEKRPCNDLALESTVKYSVKQAIFTEFSHGIFKKLNANSRIRRITT